MSKHKSLILLVSLLLLILAACDGTVPTPSPAPASPAPPTVTTPLPSLSPTQPPTPACPCISVYTLPEAGVKVMVDAIDGAQRSIKLKMYLFTERTLADALRRAAGRGVNVRALVEENPFGGGQGNRDTFNSLKESGVKWQWTGDDVFRFTHEKSLIVDDKTVYIMNHNFTRSSFTSNREYGVKDTHPADVAEVARVFDADWNKTKPDLSNARLVWSPINARERFVALIDGARASIDVEHESTQDEEVGEHLLNALRRGVKVRIVASPDEPLDQDPNERQRSELRRAGAQVRYLTEPFVHAKLFLVDGRTAFVGSQNLTTNSLNNNRELGVIFDEEQAVKTVAAAFEKDFAAGATREPVASRTATPTIARTATPTAARAPVVGWQDAAKYYNQFVTLEGKIVSTYNSGRVIYLNFGNNRSRDAKVVIFPDDWGKFPSPPDKLYDGKSIRVTGRVQEYQGAPEIIVRDPSAIVVVK